MTWNYRLFRQPAASDPAGNVGEGFYFVAECYYDAKGKPELHGTMEHNDISGDSIAETKETYHKIAEAFKAPVVHLDSEGNFVDAPA